VTESRRTPLARMLLGVIGSTGSAPVTPFPVWSASALFAD
jgi:hypothetical protein